MKKSPSLSFTGRMVPALLLLVSVLAFGLLLPRLGYYWDDWAKILVARLWGLRAYIDYYAGDRPYSAWTHILFTPILGTSPLPWQVCNLLLRWLSAWGMWWCLNGIWPGARRQNLAATLLFVVYPVFIQQPAGVTFFQQWIQYCLVFLSLGAMIFAARTPAGTRRYWLLTVLSLAAMLAQLLVTEYFAALEFVRPMVLWFVLAEACPRPRERLGQTLKSWLPYLVVTALYGVWRLFFLRLSVPDPYRAEMLYAFFANPLSTLGQVSRMALTDEIRILLTSWADLLYIQVGEASRFTLLSYGVGLAAGAAATVFLLRFETSAPDAGESPAPSSARWVREAFLLGLAAVLLGPVPAWITGRQVVNDFHSDRHAIAAMFGAGLLFSASLEWLMRRRLQVAVVTGLLVALAVGLHLRAANDYRWIWTDEQRFFWQLSWRAPGLKAPTALFLENEPFPNQGLFSTSAALNLMYPQPPGWGAQLDPYEPDGSNRLSYWIYTLRPRYREAPDSLQIGLKTTFRTLQFNGQTPDSLLLFKDPTFANCVWVLKPTDTDHPYLPALVKDFLPISNLARIDTGAAQPGYPPAGMIGPEPAHTWCYYFEKADLAVQQQDWAAAARLAAEAKSAGYTPATSSANSPYEWMPLIEGLARSGDWKEAARLTRRAHEVDAHYQPMFCRLWQQTLSPSDVTAATVKFLGCGE